jgi:hypothetical protein
LNFIEVQPEPQKSIPIDHFIVPSRDKSKESILAAPPQAQTQSNINSQHSTDVVVNNHSPEEVIINPTVKTNDEQISTSTSNSVIKTEDEMEGDESDTLYNPLAICGNHAKVLIKYM